MLSQIPAMLLLLLTPVGKLSYSSHCAERNHRRAADAPAAVSLRKAKGLAKASRPTCRWAVASRNTHADASFPKRKRFQRGVRTQELIEMLKRIMKKFTNPNFFEKVFSRFSEISNLRKCQNLQIVYFPLQIPTLSAKISRNSAKFSSKSSRNCIFHSANMKFHFSSAKI